MADEDNSRSLGQLVADTRAQSAASKKSRSSSGVRGALKAAGRSLMQSGQSAISQSRDEAAQRASETPSYRKGGMVKKTGLARLHRGEYVVPRNKVKRMKKAMRMKKTRGCSCR